MDTARFQAEIPQLLIRIHTPHDSEPSSWQESETGEKLSGKIFTKISGTKSQGIK